MKIKHIFFDLDNTLWDHRKNARLTLDILFKRYKVEELYQINFEDFHTAYDIINEDLWAKIRDEKIDKDYLQKHRF
jgi:putative hydrolase of the HAD superfamily